jgi:hypothetical protein
MAYVSKEMKAARVPAIKAVLKKYGMKGTISVRHHSTLVVKISAGKLDFDMSRECGRYDVNPYYIYEHFDGIARDFLVELKAAMLGNDWYDRSDVQTDYFDTAFYIAISIGDWDKPYKKIA